MLVSEATGRLTPDTVMCEADVMDAIHLFMMAMLNFVAHKEWTVTGCLK